MNRKRTRQRMMRIRGTIAGLALVALTVGGWYGFRAYQNRKLTEAAIEEARARRESQALETPEETVPETPADLHTLLSADTVRWQGEDYRRNTYTKAILCMGVDRSGTMTEEQAYGEAGQADGIFLIARDTARDSIRILMIPRDTMTEVARINPDGTPRDTKVTHLNVAFAYGDGRESSCRNMVQSVSHLLGGLAIDSYLAVDTSIISILNDAVGGVTVTIPNAGMEKVNPAFRFGEQVTLQGDMAEQFIRFRDTDQHQSAMFRMNQHREYIIRYFETVQELSRKDSQIVVELFELAQDHMVTDMDKGQYLKIAADAVAGTSLTAESFRTLPGTGVSGEKFDEFYPDQEAIVPLILELFYRQTS